MAAFDTVIAIWNEKYRYHAVRPFSAIRLLYGDKPVTAWGGVHFPATIPAGQAIGHAIGTLACEFTQDDSEGTAPRRVTPRGSKPD